ncbi:hypothetical protein E4U34_000197 [Claviceps purpurea]|nr:hypothetical protein E4U34_000197 [Claviceps purpurea]
MFQRLRGAIDRTIAEEQARLKSGDSATPSRSGSTSSRKSDANAAGRRPRAKKPSTDITDNGAPNPDPAVFEAAFVIDDSDEPSRTGTPAPPPPPEKDTPEGLGTSSTITKNGRAQDGASQDVGNSEKETGSGKSPATDGATTNTSAQAANNTELSPEIKQRLRKLEKLEATYPELLRSYRVAHKRATAIEPFEKALRENTPLASIRDPEALVEYINQLNLRGDMVMEELKKVSADKDELKKKHDQSEEKLRQTLEQLETLQSSQSATSVDAKNRGSIDSQAHTSAGEAAPQTIKSPAASATGPVSLKPTPQDDGAKASSTAGEDFFSYDEEIPHLQAEVASKTEEVQQLKGKVEDLQKELSAAQENSTSLAENLEKATKQLSESRDAKGSQETLQKQLDQRNSEIKTLSARLDSAQSQLKKVEEQAAKDKQEHVSKIKDVDTKSADLDAKLTKANSAASISKKLIDDLSQQIEGLKKEKSDSLAKIDELTKKIDTSPAPAPVTNAVAPVVGGPSPTASTATSGSSSKKKNNKKKKGKGGSATPAAAAASATPAEEEEIKGATNAGIDQAIVTGSTSNAALESEIAKLRTEVETKDREIEKLSKKRKSEEDLREEIENLQENLLTIGQDHVEAKERIKGLEQEKEHLEKQIVELQTQIASSQSEATHSSKTQSDLDELQKEYDDLKGKSATLQSDLGAAQQLAQTRYKDLTDLRAVLQSAQPELKSLREDSAALKKARDELSAKTKELKGMEKKETDLKRDLSKAQQVSSDREREIKTLQERLKAESTNKQRAEEGKRTTEKDLRRAEADKIEWSAKAEKTERELQKAHDELNKLRPRVKDLEEQMHKLRRDKAASQEEAEFKSQQYTNAQGLLASMRDQATELSIQLKESKSQAESLEEELSEVQRLLQERTREGETMRRLLADVDSRADIKVREMRTRMESAIEERERLEDESSILARRKSRETEQLKHTLRELEQQVKSLTHERDDLEERQREWKRRRDELEAIESKASAETEEMRSTVSQLRTALDTSEMQLREGEKQRGDLRTMLDDSRARYEKVARELKTAQSKLTTTAAAAAAGNHSRSRSSMDSTRSGGGTSVAAAGETMYLKTILLQFLEQKDARLRAQLVPVLGKLLKFDRSDEQKWATAVQHMEIK